MKKIITNTTRAVLIACLALPLLACQNDGADEQVETVQAPLVAPTGTDENEWGLYLTDAVRRNIGNSTSTYVYTLPAEDAEDFQGSYDRQLEKAQTDIARGVLPGTLLAFGSPSSIKSADLAVAALEGAREDSLEGVRFMFIGDAADSARVQPLVAPTAAEYVHIETE
ncbi:MAG: hypothetical protein M3Q40_10115 [Pseudomonadota bacterium]|nr:hypothetical protein [Pseudomonadota bacterium]